MHLLILGCASAPGMSTAPVCLTIIESQSYFNTCIMYICGHEHWEPGSAGTLHGGILHGTWLCRHIAWDLALQAHCMEPGSAGTLHGTWLCRHIAWNLVLQAHCIEPGSAGTLHGTYLALQAHCMEPTWLCRHIAWNLALQAHQGRQKRSGWSGYGLTNIIHEKGRGH